MDQIKNIKNVVVGNMKKINENIERELVITDILLRLTVLERLLISKGVMTQEEFSEATSDIAQKVAKTILQKANVPGDLDQIINSMKDKKNIGN